MNPTAEMGPLALEILHHKYSHTKADGTVETWDEIADRVAHAVIRSVNGCKTLEGEIRKRIALRQFIPGGRYLYASGRPFHQTQNCLLLRAEDSREGWSELLYNGSMGLMSGAGIGVNYSAIRAEGKPIRKTGGTATGPVALMQMLNEAGRGIIQGGSRRAAIWAGLSWSHPDVPKFISIKNWIPEVRVLKEKDFSFPATLDMTNISVILDDDFFDAYHNELHPLHARAQSVYWAAIRSMVKTGEPGFSIDTGINRHENLRNACTEVSSADDSDICNLGSINLARIDSLHEMNAVVEVATAFLVAGTVYSDVPYPKVDQIRSRNRRLGLGLMGIHEWLIMRGKPYGPDDELSEYLQSYQSSDAYAQFYAKKWELSCPVKTRAIAPTGTIGIIGETTTGLEPIFCSAYKRRYLKSKSWHYQYVLDPTAKRLIEESGIAPDRIEDAYSLSSSLDNIQRRVRFQTWIQKFVDHGISSTINLPAWGSPQNNADTVAAFGEMLISYLPQLRGITCYPDGARGGQPITAISYAHAAKHVGEIFVESTDVCDLTRGGSCGS